MFHHKMSEPPPLGVKTIFYGPKLRNPKGEFVGGGGERKVFLLNA